MLPDIRIALDFYDHPKTVRLVKIMGETAPIHLQKLWIYAAKYFPRGVLKGMTPDDWIKAFGYSGPGASGDAASMLRACIEVKFIDQKKRQNSVFFLHDWRDHNPFAFYSPERKLQAQKAAKARWGRRNQKSNKEVTKNADGMLTAMRPAYAPTPIPTPSPNPTPKGQREADVDNSAEGHKGALPGYSRIAPAFVKKFSKALPPEDYRSLLEAYKYESLLGFMVEHIHITDKKKIRTGVGLLLAARKEPSDHLSDSDYDVWKKMVRDGSQ